MSNIGNKTPEIRFKGYTEDWEQRKLGEVAKFINGRAYSQDELLNKGKYKVLRVGNFYTNDSWYYSDMELEDKFYAQKGDLLYTWSATFGPHIWCGDKIIYHYHIWKIELSDALDKSFAVQLLEQDKQSILSDKNGSTMVHITKAGMEEKNVLLPISLAEQTKIGTYFQSLDNLITLHQRKCESLKKVKKSMLQKMFPKNGASVPEIRFAGFTGDWEKTYIGSIAEIITGGTPRTEERSYWEPKQIPWLSSGEVHKKIITYTDDMISKEGFDNSSAQWVKEDSILIALAGQGKTRATVAINKIPLTTNQSIAGIIINKEYDTYFIFMSLERQYEDIRKMSSGDGTRGGLNKQLVSKIPLTIPATFREQQQIGTYFQNLDNLITLHQRKVEKLKEIKKSMLQKMFV